MEKAPFNSHQRHSRHRNILSHSCSNRATVIKDKSKCWSAGGDKWALYTAVGWEEWRGQRNYRTSPEFDKMKLLNDPAIPLLSICTQELNSRSQRCLKVHCNTIHIWHIAQTTVLSINIQQMDKQWRHHSTWSKRLRQANSIILPILKQVPQIRAWNDSCWQLGAEDNTRYAHILSLWCSAKQDESAMRYLLYNILLYFQSVKMTGDLNIYYQNIIVVFFSKSQRKVLSKKNLNVSFQGFVHLAAS